MTCPNCKGKIANGSLICEHCGNDLENLSDLDDINETIEGEAILRKPQKVKKHFKVKVVFIAAIILIIALAGAYIAAIFHTSEGEKLAESIPIGRNIEYAEKEVKIDLAENSEYSYLSKISDFNYVYESESKIKVCGITLPEWAIMVSKNSENLISKVTYYDFSQLQRNWKGHKASAKIENSVIEYGMNFSEAEKAMGFKPYSIETGIDNNTTYIYRYYYNDPETNNDIVYNYHVVFNDVDESVKLVYCEEIDYTPYMLTVTK